MMLKESVLILNFHIYSDGHSFPLVKLLFQSPTRFDAMDQLPPFRGACVCCRVSLEDMEGMVAHPQCLATVFLLGRVYSFHGALQVYVYYRNSATGASLL